jgi:hypothetical protein
VVQHAAEAMADNKENQMERLHPEDIEAMSNRVVDAVLLAAHEMPPPLITVAQTARMIAMSEDWVREHTAELGGFRMGDGPRGELRFDRDMVWQAVRARQVRQVPAPAARHHAPGRRRRTGGVVPADTRDW